MVANINVKPRAKERTYQVKDLRLFSENDTRFLENFMSAN